MKITSKQYAQALYELTKDKNNKEIKKNIINFADFLKRKNSLKLMKKIIIYYSKYYQEKENVTDVVITTASEVDKENAALTQSIKKIVNKFKSGNISIENKIDKNLLGGVILKFDDTVIDRSLKEKINKLKQSLTQ